MDYELTFWIFAGIIGIFALGVLYAMGKRESGNYIEWIERGRWR